MAAALPAAPQPAALAALLAANGWDFAAWGEFCAATLSALATAREPLPGPVLLSMLPPALAGVRQFEACAAAVPGVAAAWHARAQQPQIGRASCRER